jgi:chromosome segregation ATPase
VKNLLDEAPVYCSFEPEDNDAIDVVEEELTELPKEVTRLREALVEQATQRAAERDELEALRTHLQRLTSAALPTDITRNEVLERKVAEQSGALEQLREQYALLGEENIKLHNALEAEAQAAGRLQHEVHRLKNRLAIEEDWIKRYREAYVKLVTKRP